LEQNGVHETTIRVRYAETDQMGVAHHANYLVWFEAARTECFREHGLPYASLEKMGITLPVVECFCQFKTPARYDQLLVLQTHVVELTKVKLSIGYRVLDHEERKEMAVGGTVHAFVDRQGRIQRMSRYPEIWQQLEEIVSHLRGNGDQAGRKRNRAGNRFLQPR